MSVECIAKLIGGIFIFLSISAVILFTYLQKKTYKETCLSSPQGKFNLLNLIQFLQIKYHKLQELNLLFQKHTHQVKFLNHFLFQQKFP